MSWSLLAHTGAGSVDAGASVTTTGIDTTGANLIIVMVSSYASTTEPTLSDSKGNTWSALTAYTNSGISRIRIHYCYAPTVGSGHTFTASLAGSYPAIEVAAFSGSASSPFDVENGNTGSGSTVTTGSITPSVNGELIIAGVASDTVSPSSIDSSLTITDTVNFSGSQHFAGSLAYYVQPTAGAINPTWTLTGSGTSSTAIASFKVAASPPPPTSYTLDLGAGSYTITGADASLLYGRILDLDPGVYSITGADASLLYGRILSLDPGVYSVTGFDADLLFGRVLSLDPGVYAVTGADASLLYGRILSLDPGVYTVTGADADLIYTPVGGYVLSLDPGVYTITGADATLLVGRALDLDPGAYSITGADASLLYAHPLTLDPGAYTITGFDADMVRGYTLTLDPGVYSITGLDATLVGPAAGNTRPAAWVYSDPPAWGGNPPGGNSLGWNAGGGP